MFKSQPKTSEIRIIGPRNSGKTTYLATLAHFPPQLKKQFPGLEIIPNSDDATNLAKDAENIIKKGSKLAGTYKENVELLPYYYFLLQIPPLQKQPAIKIDLTTRDYPGEIFHDLPLEHKQSEIEPFLDDLFTVTGWLVMMTDWQPERDTYLYKPAFEKLCQEITYREQVNPAIKDLRIAVVMAKCERGELWPCRLEPDEDLFSWRLRETYTLLTSQFSPQRLQFFACSSFGVLGGDKDNFDPRPNRYLSDDGSSPDSDAFLAKPDKWNPFGLISPIYWLTTGKHLPNRQL